MDPLSITGAILAIASLAASANRAFGELRTLCKTLPGRLHALNNEVSDIELVLHEVESALHDETGDTGIFDHTRSIHHLLDQTRSKLCQVTAIVNSLVSTCKSSKIPLSHAHAWRKHQPRLQALQEDIKNVKCNLNIMLGASHSRDMTKVRVQLESVTMSNSGVILGQQQLHHDIETSLVRHHEQLTDSLADIYRQVDARIGKVEDLLALQSDQIRTSQFDQFGDSYGQQSAHFEKPSKIPRRETQHRVVESPSDVGLRVSQYANCRPGCPCACHSHAKRSSPALIDRVCGQLFVGYTGLPFMNAKCDSDTCLKSQTSQVSVEYWFPLGFLWSQIVRVQMSYKSQLGPQFEIRTLRRVQDSAQCVNFALNGNIEGLKDLFRRGLASPNDVSTTRGYSVMRWAMYGKQYQTCRFLLQAGGDPDYRPIAVSDNSPRNKAHQFLLMGGLSDNDVDALRCLTRDDDFIEDQNYTKLHKIILGLSLADLEEEILCNRAEINQSDSMGRTPLAWAACRGDERAIVLLLSHGAEVNTIDVQYSGIVGHAADRNYATCVRLLLEAGADPNISAPYKVGNPLNVAARNASDPLVLKSLLDFGAYVDSCGVDGMTPLMHASRRDMASFATLLLEYGANFNATSTAGQTPLTTAVTYNSHNVLRLLLERWFEYSECPRLTGPNLLQLVALYADLETMDILSKTDHFQLKYDSKYALGDFVCRLRERSDATTKHVLAFEELLSVINHYPPMSSPHGAESLMEAGMLPLEETDTDDETFENAMESLGLTAEVQATASWPALCRHKSKTF